MIRLESGRPTRALLRALKRGDMNDHPACECNIRVRFSEVDSLGILWHGHYVTYLEEGREIFGQTHPGIDYPSIHRAGYIAPIVDMRIEYLQPVRYGETVHLSTYYIPCNSAKLVYAYRVRTGQIDKPGARLCAIAYTVQVFQDALTKELQLQHPRFMQEWLQHYLPEEPW